MNNLSAYISSIFQDLENYLRTEVDLVEDDNKLVLDEYNSSFTAYNIQPGIYTFKDLSEAFFKILQLEYEGVANTIFIEFDVNTMKTKLVVRSGITAIRFDENSFVSTILGFTPGWDYKHYKEFIRQKNLNLCNTNKIHLKSNVIDGNVRNGVRHPILFSFVLDKKPGYKVFCEPETIEYKKINKSVLNTITFYLEDDNNNKVDFNGETLTFTLQMDKI